jgi:hypothetical protein
MYEALPAPPLPTKRQRITPDIYMSMYIRVTYGRKFVSDYWINGEQIVFISLFQLALPP